MSRGITPQNPDKPGDMLRETAADIKDTVSDLASDIREKAAWAADSAADTMTRQRDNATRGLHRAASAVQDTARKIGSGAMGMGSKVAGGIETTASYLQDHSIKDMRGDLMSVCKKYPAQAIAASAVAGFLLGRYLRR